MKRRYRKSGENARLEIERGVVLHRAAREIGEAVETESGQFISTTIPADRGPEIDTTEGERILEALRDHRHLERCVLAWGEALHEYGDLSWRTSEALLSLSLRSPGVTVEVEYGAPSLAELPLDRIHSCLDSASIPPTLPLDSSAPLRVSPEASVGLTLELLRRGMIGVIQDPRPGLRDGYGEPVRRLRGDSSTVWPNLHRGSFRVRPVRAAFDVRLDLPSSDPTTADCDLGAAIAIGPVGDRLRLIALTSEDAIAVTGTAEQWRSALTSAGEERIWFPRMAGVWGETLLIDSADIEVQRLPLRIELDS